VAAPSLAVLKVRVEDFEQPGLVEGLPAHGRGVGTRLSIMPLPPQTIL